MEPPAIPCISRIAVSARPIVTPSCSFVLAKSTDELSLAAILIATSRLLPSIVTPGIPTMASWSPLPFKAVQLREPLFSLKSASWKSTFLMFSPTPLTPTKASNPPAPKANISVLTVPPLLSTTCRVAISRVNKPVTSKKLPTFKSNTALALRKSPALPFMSSTDVCTEPKVTPSAVAVVSNATTVPSSEALLRATSIDSAEIENESLLIPAISTEPA